MVNPDRAAIRGARRALRAALAPLSRLSGFDVHHPERLPPPGPWIACCNHAAFVDTVWLHLGVPLDLAVFGGHPRLFRTRSRRALMALGNVRRVDDEAGFLCGIGRRLDAGRPALVYPEGGRNPARLGPFRSWAALASIAHRAPLVPCYLWGTSDGQAGPVGLFVGHPLYPLQPADDPASLTGRLRGAIEALAQEASR